MSKKVIPNSNALVVEEDGRITSKGEELITTSYTGFVTTASFNDHSTRHENAGADEVSVAGLSGLLADDQHVLDAEVLAVAEAAGAVATHAALLATHGVERDRVSTQFDKTNNDTLGDVTGLSVALGATKNYLFRAVLHVTADAVGGHKYAIAYSSTVTAIVYQINSISNATNLNVINSRQTASGGAAGQAGAATPFTTIEGLITTNGAGNLTVQFAQNVATPATTSSVLVGSTFTVEEIA